MLCHTDIWGSNLILSPDGTLHLVDWDGALIGPPEADLFMFAGTGFFPAERFGAFLERYEAAFRPIRLDADVLGFYLYRRNLEDLADFVDAVATGRSDAMAPADSLRLVGELLAEQARLEDRIEAIRRLLGHRPDPDRRLAATGIRRVTHGPLDFRAIGGREGPGYARRPKVRERSLPHPRFEGRPRSTHPADPRLRRVPDDRRA